MAVSLLFLLAFSGLQAQASQAIRTVGTVGTVGTVETVETVETEEAKEAKEAAQQAIGGVYGCAPPPAFINNLQLQRPVVIDTTIAQFPGVVIREMRGSRRFYQHGSWKITGHVASTVRDAQGNIYVIPIPSLSLETNPLEARNRIYKIDSNTGILEPFLDLPVPDSAQQSNPFGTLGMAYDCQNNNLYVSSVAGSTPVEQNGVIYQINLLQKRIVSSYEGIDAFGLGVFDFGERKRLYYGSARSSNIFSMALDAQGRLQSSAEPNYEFSLLHVKNGDSTQARKIRFSRSPQGGHLMTVAETEFSYRMHAETSRVYKNYLFELNEDFKSWRFVRISQ